MWFSLVSGLDRLRPLEGVGRGSGGGGHLVKLFSMIPE